MKGHTYSRRTRVQRKRSQGLAAISDQVSFLVLPTACCDCRASFKSRKVMHAACGRAIRVYTHLAVADLRGLL